MSVEFLSEATRLTKRNLLAMSVIAITIKSFKVETKEIEVVFGKVALEPAALAFIVIAVLAYLLTTFVLYFYVDAKNTNETPHEAKVVEVQSGKLKFYRQSAIGSIAADLQENTTNIKNNVQTCYYLSSDESDKLFHAAQCTPIWRDIPNLDELIYDSLHLHQMTVSGKSLIHGNNKEEPDILSIAKHVLGRNVRIFRRKMIFATISYGIPVAVTRMLYRFRKYGWDFLLPVSLCLAAFYVIYSKEDFGDKMKMYLPDLTRPVATQNPDGWWQTTHSGGARG